MHAKVVTFQIQPGKRDEAVRLFNESVIPAAMKEKGFRAGMLFTEPLTGKGISVGLWETEADIISSERSGFYQGWLAIFAGVFALPPTREIYEVSNLVHLVVE